MQPVSTHGATPIKMRSDNYNEKLRQAQAQADGNQYVTGITAGQAVKNSTDFRGVPTKSYNELSEGPNSNFQQKASTANSPMPQIRQTGNAGLQTSSSADVHVNPAEMNTDALSERVNMYTKAASNAYAGSQLNNQARGF